MLRSGVESERLSGARDLNLLVLLNWLPSGQVDAAITSLLVALRDGSPAVRKAAAGALFSISLEAKQRSAAVPQVQAVATGLMEGVCDAEPDVRKHATLALSSIYFLSPGRGSPPPPLPRDTGRFAGLLAAAAKDDNFVVRSSAIWVLRAPRRAWGAPPPDADRGLQRGRPREPRRGGLGGHRVSRGTRPISPGAAGQAGAQPAPEVRSACDMALTLSRPTPAAVPDLVKALHSKERRVRFRAADRLSYIVPRPVEVVPALLPLLEEQFTPQTAFERKHPTWSDPAAAATWAFGAIVQRTPTPGPAEAALRSCYGTESTPGGRARPWTPSSGSATTNHPPPGPAATRGARASTSAGT